MNNDVVFEPHDVISWRDEEEFDAEDQKRIAMMKMLFGFGPFFVRNIKTVPHGEVFVARHNQLLELADSLNELLRYKDSNQIFHFSGIWFKKISGRKPN